MVPDRTDPAPNPRGTETLIDGQALPEALFAAMGVGVVLQVQTAQSRAPTARPSESWGSASTRCRAKRQLTRSGGRCARTSRTFPARSTLRCR